MRRAIMLLTAAGLLVCGALVASGAPSFVLLGGRGTAGTPGAGGGIAGVELACAESPIYGSGGACLCSETMDELNTSVQDDEDFALSPNTHECWGDRANTQNFGVQTGFTHTTVDVSSRAGWGDASYALEIDDGSNNWALAPVSLITSSTRTFCYRWYQDVDDTYASAGSNGGDCPGTNWRNKLFEMMYGSGSTLVQGEERADGSCSTAPNFKTFGVQVVDEDVIDDQSGLPGGEYYVVSPAVNWNHCDGAPCRFEACIDGNIQAGTNLQVRMRVTSLEASGPSGTLSTDVFDGGTSGGAPTNLDVWGGDWWHSGNLGGVEASRRGYWSVWAWDSDTDQWPPVACEIEGGC